MSHAYALLLCLDRADEDPSEMLNLIDAALATMPEDAETARQMAERCEAIEKQLHLRYTPTGLLALAL